MLARRAACIDRDNVPADEPPFSDAAPYGAFSANERRSFRTCGASLHALNSPFLTHPCARPSLPSSVRLFVDP